MASLTRSMLNCLNASDDGRWPLCSQVSTCVDGLWKGEYGERPILLFSVGRSSRETTYELHWGACYRHR